MSEIFDLLESRVNEAELIGSSRHVAAIVHNNSVLSIGFNKRKTHPLMLRFQHEPFKLSLHAEIDAISKIKNKKLLSECDLYVLRLSKGNNISNSEPCETCKNAINHFKIKNVYWTRDNETSIARL